MTVGKLQVEAKLRKKNQLTLPEEVVRHLGAEPGDRLLLEIDDGDRLHVKVRRLLRSYYGALEGVYGETPEEVAAYIAGERASWGEAHLGPPQPLIAEDETTPEERPSKPLEKPVGPARR